MGPRRRCAYCRFDSYPLHQMKSKDETLSIDNCRCTKETSFAILVLSDFFDKGEEWIPQSQIHDDSEVYREGTEGTLVVSAWLAQKRGWL
jgi:hypothetical protein